MPLHSKLFKDDQKLQACLVNDAAHVTPGAKGDHVSKIQKAIDAVGDKVIDASEVSSKTYGASTAAAVLAYKKKRSIINFSYQTQPDNIVGKMTIDTLDREILKVEKPPVLAGSSCGWKQKKPV